MSVVLEFETFVDLAQDLAQLLDLLVAVRSGDLDPKPTSSFGTKGYAAIVT